MTRITTVLTFAWIALLAPPAHAAFLTWTLLDVRFDDGGIAEGTFDYDADTNLLIAWDISVSGGNEAVFSPFTYSFIGAGQSGYVDNGSSPADGQAFFFQGEPSLPGVNERQLRLDPDGVLTSAGGTVALDLGNPNRNVECFNCAPPRLITGGFVTTVPEPTAAVLALTGLLGMAGLRARGRR